MSEVKENDSLTFKLLPAFLARCRILDIWGLRVSRDIGAFSRTLVGDLEDGPGHFVLLLAFVAGVLGVFHFVGEFEEGVFDVFEAVWWGLAVLSCSDRGHFDGWF